MTADFMLSLYRLAYGVRTPEQLEWCGVVTGPGEGPMGSGHGGRRYVACPVCRQLEKPNGEFIGSAVGHLPDCEMARALGRAYVAPVETPTEEEEEEEEEEKYE